MAATLQHAHSPGAVASPATPGSLGHQQAPEPQQACTLAAGDAIYGRLAPAEFPRLHLACCSKLGRRKKQEDRCTLVPRVFGRDDVTFLGVFDGTVGDNAADFVHLNIVDHICGHPAFKDAVAAAGSAPGGFTAPGVVSSIEAALREGYQATDTGLIALCREAQIHYSACTSVTALLTGDLLSLAHLGDSKIVLGREEGGSGGALLVGQYLTTDHKPDMALERRRIEESGGSLAYLHGGKPFIRGGDFTVRQQRGERPMQLNYSRAFGGKDLKMYGLSCLPDICQVQLTPQDKVLVIASDGLWDVADADTAVRIAHESWRGGRDAAQDLVDWALEQHDLRGTIDNVTVVVAMFV